MLPLESELIRENISSNPLLNSAYAMLGYLSTVPGISHTQKLTLKISSLLRTGVYLMQKPEVLPVPGSEEFIGPLQFSQLPYSQRLVYEIQNMEPPVRVSKAHRKFSDADRPAA